MPALAASRSKCPPWQRRGQSARLGSVPARLLCLLRARLAALGSSGTNAASEKVGPPHATWHRAAARGTRLRWWCLEASSAAVSCWRRGVPRLASAFGAPACQPERLGSQSWHLGCRLKSSRTAFGAGAVGIGTRLQQPLSACLVAHGARSFTNPGMTPLMAAVTGGKHKVTKAIS